MSLSDITLSITVLTEEGDKQIEEEHAGQSSTATVTEMREGNAELVKIISSVDNVQQIIDATIEKDFTIIPSATNEVDPSEFMTLIQKFMAMIGQKTSSTDVQTLTSQIITFKLTSVSEAIMAQMRFIRSTITAFKVMIIINIADVNSQISKTEHQNTMEDIYKEKFDTLNILQAHFEQFKIALKNAKGSESAERTTSTTVLASLFLITIRSDNIQKIFI